MRSSCCPLMDGTRTVKEIVVERFRESGDMELSGVADLVRTLRVGNFLDGRRTSTFDACVERSIDTAERRREAREFAKTLSIEWRGAHRLVKWLYGHCLRWVFIPAVGAVVLLGGGRRLLRVLVLVPGRHVLDPGGSLAANRSSCWDRLLPDVHARARACGRPRAQRATDQERRVHDLLRIAGVLRRLLGRPDDGPGQADRAVVRRPVRGARPRRLASAIVAWSFPEWSLAPSRSTSSRS